MKTNKKEMDYEKKYKEALGWMQSLYNGLHGKTKEEAEKYFPELKESEDERIRKELIFYLGDMPEDTELRNGITNRDVLAWLEKQGEQPSAIRWYDVSLIPQEMEELLVEWDSEDATWHEIAFYHADTKTFWDGTRQVENVTRWCYIIDLLEKQGEKKPTDKVEPKFKVGDWIITKDKNVHKDYSICKIVEIENNRYHLENGDYLDIDTLEQYDYYLWTIQDAKDGDVLYSLDSKQPFIFKHRKPNEQAVVYCGINTYGKFFIWNTKDCVITTDKYIPATKEQRDTLFKAMTEAGYEWDFEKKELKLLITNGGDFESPTCWSKEDEDFYNDIIKYFSDLDYSLSHEEEYVINWLKSLKERLS